MPQKSGGKTFYAASAASDGNPSPRGKGVEESGSRKGSLNVDRVTKDMANASIDGENDGWEVYGKKSKNRVGSAVAKPWGSSANAPSAWGQSDGVSRQRWGANGGTGRTSGKNWAQANESRRPVARVIPPHLQHGWNWAARGGCSVSQPKSDEFMPANVPQDSSVGGYDCDPDTVSQKPGDVSDDDDDDLVEDSDDDFSDEHDSDATQKTHETRKQNKWFKGFFEELDKLTMEKINEQMRQWHCPACHNGPGATLWHKGLQPLLTHAKTKGATRVKLHRELALLLEEELRRRGTSVVAAGEVFGKWKGLQQTIDHEIVWPPMVVIMNTLRERDENDMWIGMGNQELVEFFSLYAAVKARHSYGPHGHRGMSVLIFEPTAMGYLEAERLHNHFAEQGKDRDAWEHQRVLFSAGGKRQLYGYLASKEDMDVFNQHSHGKYRLKFEMRSYQEMAVMPMKQMNLDNQQLIWLKNKFAKQEQESKVLEKTVGVVTQKLRETVEENRIVRLRTKIQHEEHKEEMDDQEQFFKEQIEKIHKDTEEKERIFEELLQAERAKATVSNVDSGTNEYQRLRQEEIAKFIASQVKGVEEFEAERDKLIRAHEQKKVALRQQYLTKEIELEKEFEAALTKLMDNYTPNSFEASNINSEKMNMKNDNGEMS